VHFNFNQNRLQVTLAQFDRILKFHEAKIDLDLSTNQYRVFKRIDMMNLRAPVLTHAYRTLPSAPVKSFRLISNNRFSPANG
jgi:hypothetical protein